MTCRPYYERSTQYVVVEYPEKIPPGTTRTFGFGNLMKTYCVVEHSAWNHRLRLPILALATFVAWKGAWAVFERRRRQSATPQ
jgi:hypothetical protein